jgi:DNA-binding IclR family transcriptional regulator
VIELAGLFLAKSDLRNESQPILTELAEMSGETIHLAMPSGVEVVYIAKIESRHAYGMLSHIGTRQPMYCTALGKSILAFSDSKLLQEAMAKSPKSQTWSSHAALPSTMKKTRWVFAAWARQSSIMQTRRSLPSASPGPESAWTGIVVCNLAPWCVMQLAGSPSGEVL